MLKTFSELLSFAERIFDLARTELREKKKSFSDEKSWFDDFECDDGTMGVNCEMLFKIIDALFISSL